MTELKFRVFDKKLRVWLDPEIIGINLNGVPIAPDETWLKHNLADLAIVQFTGLLDRNGKEIWEGDKLKHLPTGCIYTVEWDNDEAAFIVSPNDPSMADMTVDLGGCDLGDGEVIGNIYEKEVNDCIYDSSYKCNNDPECNPSTGCLGCGKLIEVKDA